MKTAAMTFFILSAILLIGTLKYLVELKRPGVYPPKQVLKKNSRTCRNYLHFFVNCIYFFSFFIEVI